MRKNKSFLFKTIVFFIFTSTAAWSQDSRRLIKYGPNENDVRLMTEEEIQDLSRSNHEAGHCGGYMDITDHPEKAQLDEHYTRNKSFALAIPEALVQQNLVEQLLPQLSANNMRTTVQQLSTSFESRHYRSESGVRSAQWIKQQYEASAAGRSDITVRLYPHRFSQPSVIARINGNGVHSNEVVVIGGHQDSINQSFFGNSSRAPGADDNASGTATVLEIFRVLAQSGFRPDRTIEFMSYAGEEAGLLGSQDIAEAYKQEGILVAGVMQFDMTMYPNSTNKITLINDNTSPELTQFVKSLIDTYVHHAWTTEGCGYSCSDHASWNAAGYHSAFPFEAPMRDMNPRIHSTGDLINLLNFEYGLHFAKLGLAFAIELAGIVN